MTDEDSLNDKKIIIKIELEIFLTRSDNVLKDMMKVF
jgi:hypothetical protein